MEQSFALESFDTTIFSDILEDELTQELWRTMSAPQSRAAMQQATAEGLSAIEPLTQQLASRFGEAIAARPNGESYKSFTLNLCRQLMERMGYEHVACKLMPANPFVTSAGLFEKRA